MQTVFIFCLTLNISRDLFFCINIGGFMISKIEFILETVTICRTSRKVKYVFSCILCSM